MGDMAQLSIPQPFQLPGPNATSDNIGAGLNAGVNQGYQSYQIQQALAQKQQELQMQKQTQTIQQVDTLLKNGIELPGLLPSFWPTIATKMNSISPDYKLDPNNPPQNIGGFAKALSDISDGVQGGVVSMPQAHSATQQLIKQTFPNAQDALGGGVPSGPQQNMIPAQPPQGQPMPQGGQPMPQGQPQQPQDQTPNLLQIKAQFDKANALIANAPLHQQEGLRQQLAESSLGQMYKSTLDQHFKDLSAQYGAGQENDRNQFNQNQDSVRALTSTFQNQSVEAKNVFDNLNVFNSMMNTSRQFSGAKDTTGAVNAEKTAMLAYAQMSYPGTGRPGNMEMLESMAKSGDLGTLIQQRMNQLDKGEIMTESQIKGLRQAAVGIATAREKSQSDTENTTASAMTLHGTDPKAFITNHRPSNLASTSKVFPNQGTPQNPLIGEVRKGYQFLGGKATDPDNWVKAPE